MISISLCMIVKNEENTLKRCLESVKDIVDEIIIIDTGSQDNTKSIAKNFTDKIFDFEWIDDFAKARNFSFSKATKDYTLWLDADDVILPEDRQKFLNLKQNTNDLSIDMYMLKYNVGFDETGQVNFSYYRERLLKTSKNFKWQSPIHEVITPNGKIEYTDICITHKKEENNPYTARNLKIFEKMKQEGPLDSRQQYYYARELMYNQRYQDAINELNYFLDLPVAWVENQINACLDLSFCYSQINDTKNELLSLFRSFSYDIPRSEILTSIGICFMKQEKYELSIYWSHQATKMQPKMENGGFCMIDYYKFIPYLNLCFCYSKLKKYKLANKYNEKAGELKPNNDKYLYNKQYLSKYI